MTSFKKEYSGNSENDANSEKKSGLIFEKLKVITLKNNPFYKACHENNNNNDNNIKDKKGNIEDSPNENRTEEEKGENINNNCISIKDKETRKIFKVILTIANDFQKNIKVIQGLDEEENKDKEKIKNEEEAKNLVDDSKINNTNNDDDIKTENNNSEN